MQVAMEVRRTYGSSWDENGMFVVALFGTTSGLVTCLKTASWATGNSIRAGGM